MYLHIGLPKTGTSSIQLTLYHNQAMLLGAGVLYPRDPQKVSNHRTFLAAVGGPVMARFTKLDVAESQRLIVKATETFRSDQTTRTLMWSHESLAGSLLQWDCRFLGEIAAGLDLKVILYVRYTDEWLESRYRQMLWGQTLRPMDGTRRERLLDVRKLCQGWLASTDMQKFCGTLAAKLPRAQILLRSFDADRVADQLVPKFLDLIGAPPSPTNGRSVALSAANATRPVADTALVYEMWRAGLDQTTIEQVGRALVETAKSAAAADGDLRLRLIPQDCADAARIAYAAAVEAFPQLPSQPESNTRFATGAELRERMVTRLESIREELGEHLFQQVRSVCQRN